MLELGARYGAPFSMDPLLTSLDTAFTRLDNGNRRMLAQADDRTLFTRPSAAQEAAHGSCGEWIVRSAAMVERAFNGITTRLWDDPFEWTLPEKLGDRAGVTAYLDDVEKTRKKGLAFIASDAELIREIPAPERLTPLIGIILDALGRASHYQGRAYAAFQLVSNVRPPRF